MITLVFFLPLLPLALYFLVLGAINRRQHPLMVPGTWDFAGLLFGSCGFLGIVGPSIITLLNDHWSRAAVMDVDHPRSLPSASWWSFVYLLYFLLITLGAGYQLWRHRRLTAIYNVDGEALMRQLRDILDRLQIPCTPVDHLLVLGKPEVALLEVDIAPLLHHVTLRWEPGTSTLRREVEEELRQVLERAPTSDHAVGSVQFMISMALFGAFLIGVVASVLLWLHQG